MLRVDLVTERAALADGSTAYRHPFKGGSVLVRDDALTAAKVVALFADEAAPGAEKAERLFNLMFAEPHEAWAACDYCMSELSDLVKSVAWDVYGVDAVGGREAEPLWDLDEDAAHIRTSLRMAYGIDWDRQAASIPWAEFVAMVFSLPYDTPLGFRIHHRNPANRPEEGKRNKKAAAEFDRIRRAVALKGASRVKGRAEAANDAMNDFALAMKRKADARV